jgi:two-component system sensor histidine kinase BaeS
MPADDEGGWRHADRETTREGWRRRRYEEAGRGQRFRGPSGARRGFGCLFGVVFLVTAGSLIAGGAAILSHLGPLPALILAAVVVLALRWLGRTLLQTGRSLDRLVEATSRVEAGDYSVRVGTEADAPGRIRVVRELNRGFDTMTERLETDERQRRTLLADVSHELRTPLTVVQGNIEAIIDGVYPPDPAHLALILEETRVLGRLIDDLRTLALSEAGTLSLHPEPTDPEVLVGDLVRSFEPAADAAGISLIAAIDGGVPIIGLDPVRIREVLANLVANALRHTPAGGQVTVACAVDGDRWLRLEVRDTGRGIEPALLPHVFDRFVTGDDARGSGLGLAIARQLVVAHGGEITAESVVGAGTTIRVRLPVTGG